jgi:predicted DCC family thiol-disulfide oxidoreductase YuxK
MVKQAGSEGCAPAGKGLTVFFDGACPLCAREIGLYRRARGAGDINWVDASRSSEAEIAPGLIREDALRRFHVLHADGKLTSGGRAFADLWAALPGLAAIGRQFQRWPLSVLLDGAYRLFLPVRPWLQRWLKSRARPATDLN